LIIEILEPADNEVLLALDTIFERLPFHLRLFRYRRFRWRAEICGEE
jgi:hypothetical protein